jgi:hypothetical protein
MNNKKWMPITAGIVDIIGGAFGLFFGTVYFISGTIGTLLREFIRNDFLAQIIGPIVLIAAILSLIGGIYSIKIRHWSFAMIGSICTLFVTWGIVIWSENAPIILRGLEWIPAIFTIVLTILSRKQFSK